MLRRAGGTAIAVLVLLVAAPSASAVYVLGDVEAVEKVAFPAETEVEFSSAALLANSTSLRNLGLVADHVAVHVFEKTYAGKSPVGIVRLPMMSERSWEANNVTLRTIAVEEGFVGLSSSGAGSLSFRSTQGYATEARRSPTLSSADWNSFAAGDPESPSLPVFVKAFNGEALYARAPGFVVYSGDGAIKVLGPDIILESAENSTRISTGRDSAQGVATTFRWAFIEFEGATVALDSPLSALELAATEASRVSWNGAANLLVANGSITSDERTVPVHGAQALLGNLTGRVYPIPTSQNLRIVFDGDIDPSTLPSSAVTSRPTQGQGNLLLVVAVALGVGAAGTAGIILRRRRRVRGPPLTIQDCLDWASFFEDVVRDRQAMLECVTAARRLMERPTFDILVWESSCLEGLGRLEEAIDALKAALETEPTPSEGVEAHTSIAMLAVHLNRRDEFFSHIRLALMGDPSGTLSYIDEFREVKEEDPFRPFRDDPEFRQLLREARTLARKTERGP